METTSSRPARGTKGINTTDHDANEVVRRVQLGKGRQVTLPVEVRDALQVDTGDDVEFTVHPNGDVTLRRWTEIPSDQAWFWDGRVAGRGAGGQRGTGRR